VRFIIDSGAIAANDTNKGGVGTDTLEFVTGGTAQDDLLANTHTLNDNNVNTTIEVLKLNADNILVLAEHGAQLMSLIGGEGGTTLTQSLVATSGSLYIDLSASGETANILKLASGEIFATDAITGGTGIDSLTITKASVLDDAAFAHKSKLDYLKLTDDTSLTLDGNGDASGIRTLVSGRGKYKTIDGVITAISGNFSLELGSHETNSLYIDADMAATSYIKVASGSQAVGLETLIGANNGNSTLSVGEGLITDAAFAHLKQISVLQLNGTTDLSMDSLAYALNTMNTVIGGSGSTTIRQGAEQISALVLDASAGRDNLFVMALAGQVSNNTIFGGSGTSTLAISGSDTLEDDKLANVHNVDVLSLAGGSSAVLGTNFDRTEINTIVVDSQGASTIDASGSTANIVLDGSRGSSADVLTAGGGDDTLRAGSSADTLTGGAGADLFVLGSGTGANAAIIADFTVGTDALQLTNYGFGASDYSLVGAESGPSQLFHSDTLVANISFSGSADDLLTNARFI